METVHKFISHGKHYGNVLVHCMRGVSRSASFVMGHLMMDRELTLLEKRKLCALLRDLLNDRSAVVEAA
jgi:protein-tyrosine phosphatase